MGSHLKRPYPRLGHASIGITSDVYVHLQPDSEVESMKKLEEMVFSASAFRPLRAVTERAHSGRELTSVAPEADGRALGEWVWRGGMISVIR
jgi:hypothetical protein